MLLIFIIFLICMANKKCTAQSIRDQIDINSVVNNSGWWTPYLTEYQAFGTAWDINQVTDTYDPTANAYGFDGSADSLFSVHVLMNVMIDEQILIIIRTNMVNGSFQSDYKYDEIVQWLKINDNNLLRRMKSHLAKIHVLSSVDRVSIFIAGKMRVVIQKDRGSYTVTYPEQLASVHHLVL
eukprot:65862_1